MHTGSAQLKDVMEVCTLEVSARSIVPNQSALGNGAPLPPKQREGVSSTAVAAQKYARWKDATLLLNHTVSAPNMARSESVSLQVVTLV